MKRKVAYAAGRARHAEMRKGWRSRAGEDARLALLYVQGG
jgi:hypothetical protein